MLYNKETTSSASHKKDRKNIKTERKLMLKNKMETKMLEGNKKDRTAIIKICRRIKPTC